MSDRVASRAGLSEDECLLARRLRLWSSIGPLPIAASALFNFAVFQDRIAERLAAHLAMILVCLAARLAIDTTWAAGRARLVAVAFVIGVDSALFWLLSLSRADMDVLASVIAILNLTLPMLLPWGIVEQLAVSAYAAAGFVALMPWQDLEAIRAYNVSFGPAFAIVASVVLVIDSGRLRRAMSSERARVAELSSEKETRARFVSTVSHEFRTPLTVIQSLVEVLDRYGERLTAAERAERLDKVRSEIAHMTQLLDAHVEIETRDAVQARCVREKVDLADICRQIVASTETALSRDHELVVEATGHAELDPNLLRQILSNLVTNALKYSPPGSKVRVELHGNRDHAELRVSDEGMGVPAADQARLFEPFERGSNVDDIEGTGLGLVIVQRAVEAHGGSIQIDSVEGRGTLVAVILPGSGVPLPSSVSAASQSEASGAAPAPSSAAVPTLATEIQK